MLYSFDSFISEAIQASFRQKKMLQVRFYITEMTSHIPGTTYVRRSKKLAEYHRSRWDLNTTFSRSQQINLVILSPLSSSPLWIKLHGRLAVVQSTNEGKTFTWGTGLHSLFSSSFAHNTLDAFKNNSYIINFYML